MTAAQSEGAPMNNAYATPASSRPPATRSFAAGLVAATGLSLLGVVDVSADEAFYRLQVKQGGKFLDAVNCSDRVALHPGSDYANGACQLWRFVPAGDGWSRLQLKQGGKYLDATYCSDQVALSPSSDYANGACQLWRFVRTQAAAPAQPAPPAAVVKVDEQCDQYAQRAVQQFRLAQRRRECAMNPSGRWQGNYDAHYNWCLGAQQNARGAEQQARDDWLNRCGAQTRFD